MSARRLISVGLERALFGAVLVSVLPYGSTGAFAGSLSSLVFAVVAMAAIGVRPPDDARWLIRCTLAVAALLAAFVFIQVLPNPSFVSPNEIWGEAEKLLGTPLARTVSVDPATSLATIPWLVTPLLAFAATLWLVQTDTSAIVMMRCLAYSGGLIGAFGILQFGLFPDALLLSEKKAYLDSLTTVFVNRNSAATYLGVTIIALSSLIAVELRGVRPQAIPSLLFSGGSRLPRYRLAFEIALVVVCVFALILTKSRAGNVATMVAVVAFVAMVSRAPKSSGSLMKGLIRPVASAIAAFVALGGIMFLFGGQVILRAQTRGLSDDRFCIYPSVWRAARDAWPMGSGAGTFEVVFPQYRDPACGIYGVWDRAHQFYLEGLVTIGVAMPILCILSYVLLLTCLFRGLRGRRRFRAVPAAGIAALLLVSIHDMVDFSLQIPGIAVSTAVLLGTCCAVSCRDRPARRPSTASGPSM